LPLAFAGVTAATDSDGVSAPVLLKVHVMLLSWIRELTRWQSANFRSLRKRPRLRRRRGGALEFGPALESLEGRVLLSFSTVATGATTGANPSALASADFNGDGKRDIVVANEQANTVSVLLGNGNGTLQTKTDYPVGAAPDAVATGDFNGDGHPDIVTANFSAGTISLLLGNGDGTFRPRIDFLVNGTPVSLATGDLNGDGKLDLAVAVESTTADSVEIFRGNGDGTFQALPTVVTTATTSRLSVQQITLSNLAVGDINGDGKLDIVAVNNFDSPGGPRGPMKCS
jgi:hypothetical protein